MAAKPFCKRRNELMDSLLELAIKLSIAATQMAAVAGTSETAAFVNAKRETERLRDECESVKSEIELHRLRHGC
jgi:hypothetical protein